MKKKEREKNQFENENWVRMKNNTNFIGISASFHGKFYYYEDILLLWLLWADMLHHKSQRINVGVDKAKLFLCWRAFVLCGERNKYF